MTHEGNSSGSRSVPDDVKYVQWCEDFRALNEIFWRLPILSMTLTGGIVFGLGTLPINVDFVRYLLWFVAICNAFLIAAAWRLRFGVMEPILASIRDAEGREPRSSSSIVVWLFVCLFLATAALSSYAAYDYQALLKEPKETAETIEQEKLK